MSNNLDSLSTIKSSASNPDLDWSQVRETVSLLRLAAAQVDFSMRDGEKSVNALTDSLLRWQKVWPRLKLEPGNYLNSMMLMMI